MLVAGQTLYLTLVKALGRDQLLAQYQKFHGLVQGEIELSNQYTHIFEEGRTRSGVATESAARVVGAAHFTTPLPEEAEALASEMVRIVAEQNALIPNELLHKKIAISIVAVPAAVDVSQQSLETAQIAYDDAEDLLHDALPGEIRISDSVYQSLPADRQEAYSQIESHSRMQTALWRRKDAAPSGAACAERCVMVIDMARFSRIEANMTLLDPDKGSSTLRNQINSIIAEGFKRAGAASYERYMYRFDGDGGIFIFPDPAVAHKVAVEVLKQADEKNKRSREQHFEDGMRCFRIGMDFGRLDRDARNDFSGEILARTKRLESGGPSGEIRASAEFYRRLPVELRKAYGDEEPIFGKDHDQPVPGRRLAVGARALWVEVGRDNQPFAAPKQPNNEFVVPAEPPKLELCFVVCPLSANQPRVNEVFDKLIAPACEKAGFLPRRANELPGDRKAVIAGHLSNAPLVIAYLGNPAGWNDNVILEVGFRLATGLPLVMISDADADGREPEYQHLLPFQIAHHNVITVGADPARKIDALQSEITENRSTPASSDWESPNPIVEFKFSDLKDVVVTDANESAKALFGAENLRKNQSIEKLRAAFANRTDAVQAEARTVEQLEILTKLWQRKTFGETLSHWQPPRAKIPVVFNDAPVDPETGKPAGYLPVILRYSCEESITRVRYVYLKVSASLKRHPAGYYISDL